MPISPLASIRIRAFNVKAEIPKSIGFQSALKKSVHRKDPRYRDALMKIAMLSKESTLGMVVEDVKDFEILLERISCIVIDFFETCFWETEFCEKVENIKWNPSKP